MGKYFFQILRSWIKKKIKFVKNVKPEFLSFFSSPKPTVRVNFSDHLLSVVRPFVCIFIGMEILIHEIKNEKNNFKEKEIKLL